MERPIYIVDAFTSEAFKGNPAAVCPLDTAQPVEWMQQVAAEMNLSETAFLVPREAGDGFELRWFTPAIEVPLCGHATLASAHTLWETGRLAANAEARFHTLSGWLSARQTAQGIEMDFPAMRLEEIAAPPGVAEALRATPHSVWLVRDQRDLEKNYLVELGGEAEVRALQPDFNLMRQQVSKGLIVTAQAEMPGVDFVSRYFATWAGIDEDPVTGSAHCALTPYWVNKLRRHELLGYQASARGGYVRVNLAGDRVVLGGQAVTVVRGSLLS
ncbi:MAG: PhzF family phenazine biosynthesis protein [Acidobacteria bacterium]|nr:PhzF family phenazine biosynthesis protein [Acidobacteriota bacterium]MBI3427378.1 PhzF family phenazine biosynthesis protein [Acidobacteriota bacterium]